MKRELKLLWHLTRLLRPRRAAHPRHRRAVGRAGRSGPVHPGRAGGGRAQGAHVVARRRLAHPVGEIPAAFLTDECPRYEVDRLPVERRPAPVDPVNLEPKRWIYEQYDHLVGSRTVRRPRSRPSAKRSGRARWRRRCARQTQRRLPPWPGRGSAAARAVVAGRTGATGAAVGQRLALHQPRGASALPHAACCAGRLAGE